MSSQAPTLNKRRSTPNGFTHVVRFLDHLGVSYNKARGVSRGRSEGFWQRNEGQLEWIYKDAKRAYAEAAKKAHPDYGGSHEAMAALNEGWELINRQFSLHCRGMFRLPSENGDNAADSKAMNHVRRMEYQRIRCSKISRVRSTAGTADARERATKASHARWNGHIRQTSEQRNERRRLRYPSSGLTVHERAIKAASARWDGHIKVVHQETKKRRRSLGMCAECGDPSETYRCLRCKVKKRARDRAAGSQPWRKKRRELRRSTELCAECGGASQTYLCYKCRIGHRTRDCKYRSRILEE